MESISNKKKNLKTHTHKVDTVPTAYNSTFKTFKTESFDMRSVTICRKKDTISKKKQVGVVTYSFNSSNWASEAGRSL